MRKLISVVLIAMMLTAYLTGCGGDSGGSSTEDRTDLIYRVKSEPPSLDWCAVSDLSTWSILNQMADTLVMKDEDGNIVPGLAESWEFLNDNQTVRFKLREDVKFHNGEMMTADDVVYSLNRAIANPITVLSTTAMKEAEKVDDYTVDLHLKHAYEPILECLLGSHTFITSQKAVEEMGDEAFGRAPVYSGPYQFESWETGDNVVLVANEDYWRGSPAIKKITFKIIPNANTAAIALETGEADFMEDPDSSDRENLINSDNLACYETYQAGTFYIAFNNAEGRFADERLREAVCLTVDREAIVEGSFGGNALAISNPFPPTVFGYDENIKTKEQDIERAKELVVEAGYPDGLTVDTYVSDDPMYLRPTEILQSQLKEIGINLNIIKQERGVFMTQVYYNMDYELAVGSLIASYKDADYEWVEYHGSEAGSFNYLLTDVPEINEYLETGRYSTDKEVRQEAYTNLAQYIVDHSVICPLFIRMNTIICNKDLKGVVPDDLARYHVFDYSW